MHSPVPAGQHLLTMELLLVLKTKSEQWSTYSVRNRKEFGGRKEVEKLLQVVSKKKNVLQQNGQPSDWEDRKIRGLYKWKNSEPRWQTLVIP